RSPRPSSLADSHQALDQISDSERAPVNEPRHFRALDRALAAGALPDSILRAGSRAGAYLRLYREERGGARARERRERELRERMRGGAIAELTAAANEQHYELPPEFI